MDVITSNSNQYVKLVKSLSDKKSRDELGLFMLEGERLIKDLPNDYMVEFLLVSEDKADEYDYLLKGRK